MEFRDVSENLVVYDKTEATEMVVEENGEFLSFTIGDSKVYPNLKQAQDITEKLNSFIKNTAKAEYEKGNLYI